MRPAVTRVVPAKRRQNVEPAKPCEIEGHSIRSGFFIGLAITSFAKSLFSFTSFDKGIGMKAKLATSALIVATLLAAVPAYAHHSFAAEFDGSKPTRLVGKITRVEWTNPHSYFYVDVSDPKGKITNWGCEGAGPGALSRRGWKKGDLKIGDSIVVDGYRAKDGSHLIDARRVTLPDGRSVYGGSPGDGGPGDNGTVQGNLPGTSKS